MSYTTTIPAKLAEQGIKIGDNVRVSDGTPKPPAHHKRKVRDWEGRNFTGKLVEIYQTPVRAYAIVESFSSGWMIIQQHVSIDEVSPAEQEAAA